MTEQEWLTSNDLAAMLRLAMGRISLCCGCIWCNNGDDTMSMANGQQCCRLCDNATPAAGYGTIASGRKLRLWVVAMYQAANVPYRGRFPASWLNGEPASPRYAGGSDVRKECWLWCDPAKDVKGDPPTPTRATLLRDIVGNPFRPVTPLICPACKGRGGERASGGGILTHGNLLTCRACEGRGTTESGRFLTRATYPTVLSLAEEAYAGDWSALLPLADALEEAGAIGECAHCQGKGHHRTGLVKCDAFGIHDSRKNIQCAACRGTGRTRHPLLAHLRSHGPHVRGCWAIDLIRHHD